MLRASFVFAVPIVAAAYSCGGTPPRQPDVEAAAAQAGSPDGAIPIESSEQGSGGGAIDVLDAHGGGGETSFAMGGARAEAGEQGGVAGVVENQGGKDTGGASAGGTAGDGGSAGAAGDTASALPDGSITNVPYTCSSPFDGMDFPSYFYLEDWEDGLLNTPGVTASSWRSSSSFGNANLIDSVDCDDGTDDGTCTGCDALFADGTVEVTFSTSGH